MQRSLLHRVTAGLWCCIEDSSFLPKPSRVLIRGWLGVSPSENEWALLGYNAIHHSMAAVQLHASAVPCEFLVVLLKLWKDQTKPSSDHLVLGKVFFLHGFNVYSFSVIPFLGVLTGP